MKPRPQPPRNATLALAWKLHEQYQRDEKRKAKKAEPEPAAPVPKRKGRK